MQEKQTKRSVLMVYQNNEKGFTFVSMFLAITIISITLPFFSYLLQMTSELTTNHSELSTLQFFQFIRDEVIRSENMAIENNKLVLHQADSIVTIEQYGNLIHRQVGGKGHEVLLRDVEEITFHPSPYGVDIIVTNMEGASYEKTIIFYQ